MRRGTDRRVPWPPALEQFLLLLRERSLRLEHVLAEAHAGCGEWLALELDDTVPRGEVRL
jgi:hypothetical protein